MILVRRLAALPLVVSLMAIGSASMVLPAAYAVVLGQFAIARAFFYSGSVLLIFTAMIAIATASHRPRYPLQSLLMSVVGGYLVLPVLLAVPVHQATPGLPFSNAWFEMLSCLTATGASVFETPLTVALPIHLWRSWVGWLGGFYYLVVIVSVLAPMGLGGVELLGGGVPGRAGSGVQITRIADPSQRIVHFSTRIFPVYLGLTVVLWVGLLVAGDSAFVALCIAMGTISTSGISPLNGLAGLASGWVGEALIFLLLGLAVTRRLWPSAVISDRRLKFWHDPELRLALVMVVVVSAVVVLLRTDALGGAGGLRTVASAAATVWTIVFTTLSFLTTTGFQSASWPDVGVPGLFLLGLAMIGGGVATTAGGVKLLRVYALLRHGERELERIVHPHSIGGHGPLARRLRREGAYLAWIFFMTFGLAIAAVTVALSLSGLAFQDALVFGIACLTTTGQLANVAADVPLGYATLTGLQLAILGAAMILGRLEIFAIFVLLAPKGWSR